jgi:hypothetical protein
MRFFDEWRDSFLLGLTGGGGYAVKDDKPRFLIWPFAGSPFPFLTAILGRSPSVVTGGRFAPFPVSLSVGFRR